MYEKLLILKHCAYRTCFWSLQSDRAIMGFLTQQEKQEKQAVAAFMISGHGGKQLPSGQSVPSPSQKRTTLYFNF